MGRILHRLRWQAALAAVSVLAFLPWLGAYGLVPEEARYAEIARETLEQARRGGDAITPRLDGVAYFEKPPLLGWLGAAALATGGAPEWALRLVPAIATVAAAFAAAAYAARVGGSALAFATGLAAVGAPLTALFARIYSTDAPFAGAITVAIALAGMEERPARRRAWAWLGASAALAVAACLRGPIAFALFAPIVLLGTVRRGEIGAAVVRACVPSLAGAVLAAPVFFLVAARNPSFFHEFFVEHNLGRVVIPDDDKAMHPEPVWYFLPIALGAFGVAALAVPVAIARGVRRWREEPAAGLQLPLAAVAWTLVLLSAISGKRASYLLPALPWLGLLVASLFLEARADPRRARLLSYGFLPSALAGLALAAVLGQAAIRNVRPLDAHAALVFVPLVLAAAVAPWFWFRSGRPLAAGAWAAAGQGAFVVGVAWFLPRVEAAGQVPLAVGTFVTTVPAETIANASLAREVAQRAHREDLVADHGRFRPALPFYTERLTTVFGSRGELAFGVDLARDDPSVQARFRKGKELADALRGSTRVFALIMADRAEKELGDAPRVVLARRGQLLLVSNRPDP
ncbi:MAG TPA: phospholipid carrier-dependent glycosyltransferase [Planctomycetota bacterium]|nr:phospholipid carrier-dependent glycosyltransferase [Planctomycetota bacterium]